MQASFSQTFPIGLTAQLTYASNHIHVNSKSFAFNPYTSGDLDLTLTQNLLNGFGKNVNTRNIRVQKNNLKALICNSTAGHHDCIRAEFTRDLVTFNEEVKSASRRSIRPTSFEEQSGYGS